MPYRVLVGSIVLGAVLFSASTRAASPQPDCLAELERGRGSEIACEFPTRLTDEERSELRAITRQILQDAHCIVSIRIERALVDAALAAEGEHTFAAPPQPVRCEIATRERTIVITGAFAPRVVFKGGRAVEATPGLGNVDGVSPILAWPAVEYVNRAGTIGNGMLTVINAYRAHRSMGRQAGVR